MPGQVLELCWWWCAGSAVVRQVLGGIGCGMAGRWPHLECLQCAAQRMRCDSLDDAVP